MCIVFVLTVSFIADAKEIMTRYNNFNYVESTVTIYSSGIMKITNSFSEGPFVFTKVIITTYVEKKVLRLFWSRVDIGEADDEWIDEIYTKVYSETHSTQISSTGTYMVIVEYVIYGSGGTAETITQEIEKKY